MNEQADILNESTARKLQKFTLLDDVFMTKILRDKECLIEVLKLILEKDNIEIDDIHTEEDIKNVSARSVVLDILAHDTDGNLYNIEVQNETSGAKPERARYHSAMIDADRLQPQEDFKELPETYVIFITAKDYFKKDLHLYHIDRIIKETGDEFQDRAHIIYFNTSKRDDTEIGKLAQDFHENNPDKIHNKILKKRITEFKEGKGVKEMSTVVEEIREEGIQEGIQEGTEKTLYNLYDKGYTIQILCDATGFTEEKVKELIAKREKAKKI